MLALAKCQSMTWSGEKSTTVEPHHCKRLVSEQASPWVFHIICWVYSVYPKIFHRFFHIFQPFWTFFPHFSIVFPHFFHSLPVYPNINGRFFHIFPVQKAPISVGFPPMSPAPRHHRGTSLHSGDSVFLGWVKVNTAREMIKYIHIYIYICICVYLYIYIYIWLITHI